MALYAQMVERSIEKSTPSSPMAGFSSMVARRDSLPLRFEVLVVCMRIRTSDLAISLRRGQLPSWNEHGSCEIDLVKLARN